MEIGREGMGIYPVRYITYRVWANDGEAIARRRARALMGCILGEGDGMLGRGERVCSHCVVVCVCVQERKLGVEKTTEQAQLNKPKITKKS